MTLFLTGYTGGSGRVNGQRVSCEFSRANGFADLLRQSLPDVVRCLVVTAEPSDYDDNDAMAQRLLGGFKLDGFNIECVDMCDDRNAESLVPRVNDYNLLFLGGGHVPTQIEFFQRINLREAVENYRGIVVGRSAGAMSCADVVYAPPELDGEAIDANYERYLTGLGLTDINIFPHFEYVGDTMLDGLHMTTDILLADSRVRPFYAITDKSFIYISGEQATVHGEAYLFEDDVVKQICRDGEVVGVNKH